MWVCFSGFRILGSKNVTSHGIQNLCQPICLIDDKCVCTINPRLGRGPLSTAAKLKEDILQGYLSQTQKHVNTRVVSDGLCHHEENHFSEIKCHHENFIASRTTLAMLSVDANGQWSLFLMCHFLELEIKWSQDGGEDLFVLCCDKAAWGSQLLTQLCHK